MEKQLFLYSYSATLLDHVLVAIYFWVAIMKTFKKKDLWIKMKGEIMKEKNHYIKIGCGCIIINEKNEILLLKRSRHLRNEPGMWSRPGGTVEFGETIENALKREIKEEIGVDIEIIEFLEYTELIDKDKHWIAFGFLAKIKSGEVKNLEPHKHEDIRWFPLNNLPKNITPYTKKSIEIYLNLKKKKTEKSIR